MDLRLSENFSLNEFLTSQIAERTGGQMLTEQCSPNDQVIENLDYLVFRCLQPLRTLLNTPMTVTSGYRCDLLNSQIGSHCQSQHLQGEAADLTLSNRILDDIKLRRFRRIIENKIIAEIGCELKQELNANFYLFACAVLYKKELGIDQLIHEYGHDGCPAWVHISCSQHQARGEIIKISQSGIEQLNLQQALSLAKA